MNSFLLHFTFSENAGISRQREPVRFGVPIQSGGLINTNRLALLDNSTQKTLENSHINSVSSWPDGSCQWLEISTVLDIDAGQSKTLALVVDTEQLPLENYAEPDTLTQTTVSGVGHRLDSDGSVKLEKGGSVVQLSFFVTDTTGKRVIIKLESQHEMQHDSCLQQIIFKGVAPSHSSLANMQFTVRLSHHFHSDILDLHICIHNPTAAKHVNGLWDLGDPNSIDFRESGVIIDYVNSSEKWLELHSDNGFNNYSFQNSLKLNQLASGGDNGSSAVHMNKHGKVEVLSNGFELELDGNNCLNGKRAEPIVSAMLDDAVLRIHLSDFWEAFPTAISSMPGRTEVQLHAGTEVSNHELQPGERSTKMLTLGFDEKTTNAQKSWLANRLTMPVIEAGELCIADSILQHALADLTALDKSLLNLVVDPDIFLHKREVIDEYGWRNFGDVFADHESLYVASGDKPLVSHYNNQYDLMLGFGLQYLRTMDSLWLRLMNDLANHVNDIDIYHTELDRVEYNGGLFWHTNHYQDAHTATHRTFSVKHYNEKQPWGTSGGVSAEHCYTGGLALHYFLTRDATSAESVLKLARWISSNMDGDSCLLGRLHSIAKFELRNIIKCVRRRSVVQFQYPFTRATGNFLNACLDSYAVSGDRQWLTKADFIVENTFHCDDEIASRDLENIEGTWFHTIFLQAVVRYMVVKLELGEADAAYVHSKHAYLHYLHWMAENTVPYLENPSVLEFVNDTWAAQDIRRHGLLIAAANLDSKNEEYFLSKANQYKDHIVQTLGGSDTLSFTRIQAIILQNISLCAPMESDQITIEHEELSGVVQKTVLGECLSAAKKIGHGLRNFHWKSEYRWLRSRF